MLTVNHKDVKHFKFIQLLKQKYRHQEMIRKN